MASTTPAGHALLGSLRQHVHRIVLVLAALVTFLVVVSLAGAALDDAAIDAATRYTTAEVLSVSSGRAIVRYTTPNGEIHVPAEGVAYPAGLEKGQRIRVAYAADEPARVRVAGRDWTTGLLPAALVVTVTWLVALPLAWWLRRAATTAAAT